MEELLNDAKTYIKEEDISVLRDFLDFNLSSQKALYFYGRGNNGKSTLLKKIEKYLNGNFCYFCGSINSTGFSDKNFIIFNEYTPKECDSSLKQLLGSDPIYVRAPFSKRKLIDQPLKILVVGNDHLSPTINARVKTIEFINVF